MRNRKAENSIIFPFRPTTENEAAWFTLRKWCEDHEISVSALLNSLIIPLKIATMQTADEVDAKTLSIEVNFGTITIKKKLREYVKRTKR